MENEDFICENCETEFTLIYDKETDKPEYCPFCGNSLEQDDDADWVHTESMDEEPYED